jgi:predicted lactoylglutathione lyase
MEIKGAKAAPGKNAFIESQFGFRYLTIMVADTTASVEKATAAGVKPIANGTVAIPKDIAEGMYLTILKDPDGNFVELVGPKK